MNIKYLAAVGALALGFSTLAPIASAQGNDGQHDEHVRRGPGIIADITSVSLDNEGVGSLTLTVVDVPPRDQKHEDRVVPIGVSYDELKGRVPGGEFKGKLTPPVLPEVGSSITVAVNASTKVMVDGEEGTTADLTTGLRVRIFGSLSADGTVTAKLINTDLSKGKHHRAGAEVSAVDTEANTFTVELKPFKDHEAASATVNYSDNTVFYFGKDGQASESDLSVGSKVHFKGTVVVDDNGVSFTDVTEVHLIVDADENVE
ncbi:MAG: DUF5666 domain-containing protein [Patescibacteria group bacterium]